MMSARPQYCTKDHAAKVGYEFRMFKYLCDKLESTRETRFLEPARVIFVGTGGFDEEELHLSAMLESLLLHTRVLIDFFSDKKDSDNLIASDFVDAWNKSLITQCVYLNKRKPRLNKAVAHLAAMRVEYETDEKQWEITTIHAEMEKVIDQFTKKLTDERKAWFPTDWTT